MEIEPGHLELSGVPVATYFRTHKRSASLCSKQIVLSELNNKAGPQRVLPEPLTLGSAMELMPGAPLWDSRVRFAAAERYDLERPQTRAVSSTKEKPAGQGAGFL